MIAGQARIRRLSSDQRPCRLPVTDLLSEVRFCWHSPRQRQTSGKSAAVQYIMELHALTIHALQDLLSSGEISSLELTRSVLDRIDAVESKVNAYITLDRNGALAQAEAADAKRKRGEGGSLCGIPLSIKDVLCTKGLRTTAGSKILEPFIPPYDATVVEKLREKAR